MALYALGDLHLGQAVDKPMDVFGPSWENHADRIHSAWCSLVSPDDTVLIPGDISWAMTLEEAQHDLHWIAELPGKKVMIRGNHDYWWHGISKVRRVLPSGMIAIQNDAFDIGDAVVCGTRGWVLPTHPKFEPNDDTIFRREVQRLRLSLQQARPYGKPIVVMMHYPPCGQTGASTAFTDVLTEFGVTVCLYGHLHGTAHRFAFEGEKGGVRYRLVSADYVQFSPVRIELQ
ncbi:MAG: metallophosphoesterase [Alicyclobacillus sp.]|nr:metallophosphoesterase [Alicyclobacillus sp.]